MKCWDFVKNIGFVVGGLMMVFFIFFVKVYVVGEDIIKVGFIGCGGCGIGVVFQVMFVKEFVKLVVMVDVFQDWLESSYKQLQVEMFNYEIDVVCMDVFVEYCFYGFDVYKQVIDLCDVVLIVIFFGFCFDYFEAVIKVGKYVFMEKFLAVDGFGVCKVLEIVEFVKKKKLNVVVGLQWYY